MMEPAEVTHFESPAVFRAWLARHHATREVLWVGYWKKPTGRASITWEESVDEALCFGWIDGLRKRLSEEAYTIRFTPRRSDSNWSMRNLERYAVLDAAGRIELSGKAAFGARKPERSGTYSFEQQSPPELPDSYVARLRADADAWEDWQARPPGYRRRVAHWITSAAREETRERRLAALIEDSAAGREVKPFRR